MIKCLFTRKKLYAYIEGSLAGRKKAGVEAHLKECGSCRQEVEELKRLLELSGRPAPVEPSAEFWHDFQAELDGKLNERLVGTSAPAPVCPLYRPKPAFAMAVALVAILSLTMFLNFKSGKMMLAREESALVEELSAWAEEDPDFLLEDDELLELPEDLNKAKYFPASVSRRA